MKCKGRKKGSGRFQQSIDPVDKGNAAQPFALISGLRRRPSAGQTFGVSGVLRVLFLQKGWISLVVLALECFRSWNSKKVRSCDW